MATRINMLKLLQEVRGFAQFAQGPTEPRPNGPLLLEFRSSHRRKKANRRRQYIKIDMQEPTDIPRPVPIIYRQAP
jgi:hypothetical protein